MNNLISNTAFGKYLDTLHISLSAYKQIRQRFDSFLLQILELWMFVPCKLVDGVWVFLEKPDRWEDYLKYPDSFDGNMEWYELYEYQEAKERCLFEGFILSYSDVFVKTVSKGTERGCFKVNFKLKNVFIHRDRSMIKIIEDLVEYNILLTPTSKKQIGL